MHLTDLDIALRHTCDYRRYSKRHAHLYNYNNQPRFFRNVKDATAAVEWNNDEKIVFVLSKICGETQTQSDYYVQYVVRVN